MLDDFIRDKELEFAKGSKDMDDFWGGVDSHDGDTFELFFTAGKDDGPSPDQVAKYHSLLEHLDAICHDIHSRAKTQLLAADPEEWQKFENSPLGVLFVTVRPASAENDVELTCCVSRKGFIFRKHKNIVADIRDNAVVSVEVF